MNKNESLEKDDSVVESNVSFVLNYFGIDNQIDKYIEEANEVFKACIEFNCDDSANILKRKGLRQHIIEEIADMEFVLDQIRLYYGILEEEEEEWSNVKQARTIKRINEGYYTKKED